MDEKQERHWRRKAIRMMLQGIKPRRILEQFPRNESWFYKWRKRCERFGWSGLYSAHRKADRRRLMAREICSLPETLPITEGRIHFLRCVTPEGQISLLNDTLSTYYQPIA